MAKRKKKRNKVYSGQDAAIKQPVVHRYEAVERSVFGEWWLAKKRVIKIGGGAVLVIAFIVWMIIEAVTAI